MNPIIHILNPSLVTKLNVIVSLFDNHKTARTKLALAGLAVTTITIVHYTAVTIIKYLPMARLAIQIDAINQ